jgi:hypothetical protein
MTWGIESNAIERFSGAGIPRENISFEKKSYTFEFPGAPSEFLAAFRRFYGPTMNAFEAAERSGRAHELQGELDALFNSQNRSSSKDTTSIRATYLSITVRIT